MVKASRPWVLESCCFSVKICSTKAVDDKAKPKPTIKAVSSGKVKNWCNSHINSVPVRPTCKPPRTNIERRSAHNREGCNSRPMINNSMTTPNSEKCNKLSASPATSKPLGPNIKPVIRYPNTVAIPKRLPSGTNSSAAPKKIVACNIKFGEPAAAASIWNP